jgi:hypothetical protein
MTAPALAGLAELFPEPVPPLPRPAAKRPSAPGGPGFGDLLGAPPSPLPAEPEPGFSAEPAAALLAEPEDGLGEPEGCLGEPEGCSGEPEGRGPPSADDDGWRLAGRGRRGGRRFLPPGTVLSPSRLLTLAPSHAHQAEPESLPPFDSKIARILVPIYGQQRHVFKLRRTAGCRQDVVDEAAIQVLHW